MTAIDPDLLDILECPRCRRELRGIGESLRCPDDHRYPIVDGVPVFLIAEKPQTQGIAKASLVAAETGEGGPLYLDTLGLSAAEKYAIKQRFNGRSGEGGIDPAIMYLIGATCGIGYRNLIGRAAAYPIPRIPVERGEGQLLLDVGCNWGRWSVSAHRRGWRVVGVDPSLGALVASRRAFKTEELMLVCGDARFMPFKSETFSRVFSYSVLQHFAESDMRASLVEINRVLMRGGASTIQMAHWGGLRSPHHRKRHDSPASGEFHVRYWKLKAIQRIFSVEIGPTKSRAEAFGGLGLLSEDWLIVSLKAKAAILISAMLKCLTRLIPSLIRLADSVYVVSTRR
jgi:uncharacterized protein YbaR (Trm112 family)